VWERLYELGRRLFTLTDEMEQTREDIKGIRQELRDLTTAVTQLRSDLNNVKDREANERDKLILQLQNTLLRFERHIEQRILPPGKD
jgi:chromosome segregation ATPase